MITKREVYKKVYWVYNPDEMGDAFISDELLMCGTPNWNYYFAKLKNKKKLDFDEMKNVELIEFDNRDEMFKFWESTKDSKKIDWSEEHKNPCLLKSL